MSSFEQELESYRIDRGLFRRAIDFRAHLLKLRPDHQVGRDIEEELMVLRVREEAYIQAEALDQQIKGPLLVLSGLTMGSLNSLDSYIRVAPRVFRGEPPEMAERLARQITDVRYLAKGDPLGYANALVEGVERVQSTTKAAIERGRYGVLGYRLLGMAAYWGAAADPPLRQFLQDTIRDEFVRPAV